MTQSPLRDKTDNFEYHSSFLIKLCKTIHKEIIEAYRKKTSPVAGQCIFPYCKKNTQHKHVDVNINFRPHLPNSYDLNHSEFFIFSASERHNDRRRFKSSNDSLLAEKAGLCPKLERFILDLRRAST